MPTTVRVARTSAVRHARWARCTHWIIASSVLALTLSGGVILIVVTDEFDDLGRLGPLQNGWSWYAGI